MPTEIRQRAAHTHPRRSPSFHINLERNGALSVFPHDARNVVAGIDPTRRGIQRRSEHQPRIGMIHQRSRRRGGIIAALSIPLIALPQNAATRSLRMSVIPRSRPSRTLTLERPYRHFSRLEIIPQHVEFGLAFHGVHGRVEAQRARKDAHLGEEAGDASPGRQCAAFELEFHRGTLVDVVGSFGGDVPRRNRISRIIVRGSAPHAIGDAQGRHELMVVVRRKHVLVVFGRC
mmetsp:Transcript_15788/g.33375  ORF Transcript_15788/g.33375 Transcript_15788/m.33375 type:complete len:232 (-) Transcript_15788:1077-1772(-)